MPGDRLRSVNWRASARRSTLIVNDFHPERNTDVLLFLDSFAEARAGGRGTLDDAVRATVTLATKYLERRDRVGLVTFGGILRWLAPNMGVTQRWRLIDALLETDVELNYAWKDVSVIPARVLSPQALVVAITPLLDTRSVTALLDLRARGFDLAIVEVSPEPFVETGRGRPRPARAPPLAAPARRAPRPLPAPRRRRRPLGRRDAPRRRTGGGERIEAPRPRRSRASDGRRLGRGDGRARRLDDRGRGGANPASPGRRSASGCSASPCSSSGSRRACPRR